MSRTGPGTLLATSMRSDRWHKLISDLKRVPPLVHHGVKFRVNRLKTPKMGPFSSPPPQGGSNEGRKHRLETGRGHESVRRANRCASDDSTPAMNHKGCPYLHLNSTLIVSSHESASPRLGAS